MTKNQQKIAQIIVFKKLPRSLDYFDYLIPEKFEKIIKPGHLVELPFKSASLLGIVDQIKNTSDFNKLKQISKIHSTVSYLSKNQMELIHWFAEQYFYSLSSTLKLMVPQPPKKLAAFSPKKLILGAQKLAITSKVKNLSAQLTKDKSKKFLIESWDINLKYQLLIEMIKKTVKINKQILILFPQIYQINNFTSYLPKQYKSKISIIDNELFTSKNRHYHTWQKIKANEKQIIIGTRSAIFAPASNLELIFINNQDSEDYKNWDQNPRFSAIEVAQKIQRLTNCKLICCSPSPRIESYYKAKKQNYKFIRLAKKPLIKTIDLTEQRRLQFTYLSDKLIDNIEKTLRQNKKVLLIVNKKGFASYLFCQDCKYIAKCPKCNFPLTYSKNQLSCFHCQVVLPTILKCPKCHGSNLIPLGIGIEQIEQQIKNLFPTFKISTNLDQNADIYLSTAQIKSDKIWSEICLLGIVYIDSLMYFPDFSTNFKIYQLLSNLAARYQSLARSKQKILLQTCFIENLATKNISNPYIDFYNQEIKNRQQFDYPPFASLIKLFFQHHDKYVCQKEAQNLYLKLKQIKLNPSTPYLYYRQQIRNRFRCQILLKLDEKSLAYFKKHKQLIPDYWTIDKNPLTVL